MPLLTVVIPTFDRPKRLFRAIESSLLAAPAGDVEVIVVANGPSSSWTRVAERFQQERRVRWKYLPTANACAARNIGMAHSAGKYIRFLDDDDVLLPASVNQLLQLDDSSATVSSAPLLNIWNDSPRTTLTRIPSSDDFVVASLLSLWGMGFNQGTIFLRSAIHECAWPVAMSLYDDYVWLLEVALRQEQEWVKFSAPTASYMHHAGDRLSRLPRSPTHSKQLVGAIWRLHAVLLEESRLSTARNYAVATALLTHAHSVFPQFPDLATSIIKDAIDLDDNARPAHPIFRSRHIPKGLLLPLEWLAFVPRYFSHRLKH